MNAVHNHDKLLSVLLPTLADQFNNWSDVLTHGLLPAATHITAPDTKTIPNGRLPNMPLYHRIRESLSRPTTLGTHTNGRFFVLNDIKLRWMTEKPVHTLNYRHVG